MEETTTDHQILYIDQAASAINHALAHGSALCKVHDLPMTEALAIAETILEHAAELATAQLQDELVEAAGKASSDPLLGRFLGGMQ